jgi:hypothetical protein
MATTITGGWLDSMYDQVLSCAMVPFSVTVNTKYCNFESGVTKWKDEDERHKISDIHEMTTSYIFW